MSCLHCSGSHEGHDPCAEDRIRSLRDEIARLEQSNVSMHRDMVGRLNAATAERDRARDQLSAMTKARDEACAIATLLDRGKATDRDNLPERIAELRKVGQ